MTTARCCYCDREVRTLKNGTVARHGFAGAGLGMSQRGSCPGSNERPGCEGLMSVRERYAGFLDRWATGTRVEAAYRQIVATATARLAGCETEV